MGWNRLFRGDCAAQIWMRWGKFCVELNDGDKAWCYWPPTNDFSLVRDTMALQQKRQTRDDEEMLRDRGAHSSAEVFIGTDLEKRWEQRCSMLHKGSQWVIHINVSWIHYRKQPLFQAITKQSAKACISWWEWGSQAIRLAMVRASTGALISFWESTLLVQPIQHIERLRFNCCCIEHPLEDTWFGTIGQHQDVQPIMTIVIQWASDTYSCKHIHGIPLLIKWYTH